MVSAVTEIRNDTRQGSFVCDSIPRCGKARRKIRDNAPIGKVILYWKLHCKAEKSRRRLSLSTPPPRCRKTTNAGQIRSHARVVSAITDICVEKIGAEKRGVMGIHFRYILTLSDAPFCRIHGRPNEALWQGIVSCTDTPGMCYDGRQQFWGNTKTFLQWRGDLSLRGT